MRQEKVFVCIYDTNEKIHKRTRSVEALHALSTDVWQFQAFISVLQLKNH